MQNEFQVCEINPRLSFQGKLGLNVESSIYKFIYLVMGREVYLLLLSP